jgi:signal transduction histidine kinase
MELEVSDDGRGITATEAAGGTSLGLLGMRERAALLGGRVEIDGTPGRGTTVHVHVPVHGAAVQ